MGANEKSVETGGVQLHQIIVGAQAGFADGNAIIRDAADQFERSIKADRERSYIAIVYA